MRPRALALTAALLTTLLAAAWLGAPDTGPDVAAGPVLAAPPPVPPAAAPPETVPPPRRVRVPRPSPEPTPAVPVAPRVAAADAPPTPTPPDRRPLDTDFPQTVGADPTLRDALGAALQDRGDELLGCLAGWHDAQPDVFLGFATFAFHLDAEGLADLELLDVDTLPEATLDCLGDVLWDGVDWPTSDEPTEVTWPIQVSVPEEPAADDRDGPRPRDGADPQRPRPAP